MRCDFHRIDGNRWKCAVCERETITLRGDRVPVAACRCTPQVTPAWHTCEHRGPIVGTLTRESCGCDEQPLYECGLYEEPVTLRRHRKHPGRNCLDCKLDAEEVADQLGKQ